MVKENWCDDVWLNRLASGSWLVRSAFLYSTKAKKSNECGASRLFMFFFYFLTEVFHFMDLLYL